MRFGVLGPVEAWRDDEKVELGPKLHRSVLAALLTDAGRTVSTATIIDRVWGEEPGQGVTSSLQAIISRLRSKLGSKTIVTQQPGYRLVLDDATLDSRTFTESLTNARDAAARGATREARALVLDALALWRGQPYADIELDFAIQEADDLHELRIAAVELAVELDLTLGLHHELVERLPVLVREHPLREGLRTSLMLALYRSGRQAEALAVYDEGREQLSDQLGIDPGPKLREMHGRILRQEPDLLADAPVTPHIQDHSATTNLTPALTELVGRDQERSDLADLLDQHRLITVFGTGGMGKTRLASTVALDREDRDGPWFVDLAALTDGVLLAETVATAMGLGIPGGIDGLATVLRDRETVLILDNCEQIVEEVTAFVTVILSRCPRIRILATSREILGAAGEVIFELSPLPTIEAADLFVSRAKTAQRGWEPTVDEEDIIRQICADLDNLPLAIELAAAQTRALSLGQLAEMLDDRFAVLRGGARSNKRHMTMTAAVDWSYTTLDAQEQGVFRALALLEGTFDLEGARAVTGRADVMEPLLSLIDKSLVVIAGGDPRRYRILQTLRQYAADHRDEAETSALRERVISWISSVADVADANLRGPQGKRWMQRLEQDQATIRVALTWTANEPARQLLIASGVYWFWYRKGHITEGVQALSPILTLVDPATGQRPDLPVKVLVRGSVGLALLSYLAGDLAGVGAGLARAGVLAATTDDVDAATYALCTIAYFEAASGQTAEALAHAQAGLQGAQSLSSSGRIAEALMPMGMAYFRAGELGKAQRCLEAAVEHADAAGYLWCADSSLWILAKVRIESGEFSSSTTDLLRRMIADCESDSDLTSWVVGLLTLAYVLFLQGQVESAAELVGTVDRQSELIGFTPEVMDPVELLRYRTEMRDELAEHADAVQRGRDLAADQVGSRVGELLAAR